jgi:glycosyltransferase involved in cell wall biosynthesis
MKKSKIEVLIKKFNQKDTILVISKYPYKNIGESFHGVAVYTKNTLEAIAKRTDQKFVVLIENKYQRQVELVANGSILLLPVFDNHPIDSFKQLLKVITKFDRVANIQLHSEFYNSGNLVQMSLLIPFLWLLRLKSKIVSFVAHNVVHDFSFLSNHLGKRENSLKLTALVKMIPWYYRFLSVGVEQFITLDESIHQRLSSYLWKKSKVKATSIWLKNKRINQKQRNLARHNLKLADDEIVLAVFGFMSRYKGVDTLLNNFIKFKKEFPNSKFKLLLAGGMAPSQKEQKHYQAFYQKLEKLSKSHQDVLLTGFIPEKEMKKYLALTDVVLLPYQGILGASASWAMVLSYAKACFFSEALAPYFLANDVQQSLAELKMNKEELIFNQGYCAFKKLLIKIEKNPVLIKKASAFSKILSTFRDEKVCIFRDFPPLYFPRLFAQKTTACYNLNDEKIPV